MNRKLIKELRYKLVKNILKNRYLSYGINKISGVGQLRKKRSYKTINLSRKFYRKSAIKFLRYTTPKVSSYKFFFLQNMLLKKFHPSFTLKQRWFTTLSTLNKSMWNFFYSKVKALRNRSWKKKINTKPYVCKKKITIYNLHKSPIWKMRMARYSHWNFKRTGTLNEYRYNKFLSKEIPEVYNFKEPFFFSGVFLRMSIGPLSWKQILFLISYKLVLINGVPTNSFKPVKGDIVEIPFKVKSHRVSFELSKFWQKLTTRIKRLSYKSFFKLRRNNSKFKPKLFKKAPFAFKYLGSITAFDPYINSTAFIFNIRDIKCSPDYEYMKSSVLTLQNWRYRFD